jgi:ubiquinone/menaquinone biosynthesis C-methylase UbiE
MRRFLRQPARAREPLAVAMSGVRMGERVLQIGLNDPALAGVLVAKAGLSGHAAIAVASDAEGERARQSAAAAGALADVHVTPLHTLPFPADGFDVAVVHSADGLLASFDDGTRLRVLGECRRVLRHGGRAIVIEAQPRSGLRGLFSAPRTGAAYDQAGGSAASLEGAGFRAVRVLAERDGYRFTEGLKR